MKQIGKMLLSSLGITTLVKAADKTCNLWQVCSEHSDLSPGDYPTTRCQNGGEVVIPTFVKGGFAPQPMASIGTGDMEQACPFFEDENPGGDLCCNPDTARIMGKFSCYLARVAHCGDE